MKTISKSKCGLRETQSCIIYPKINPEVETKVEISSAAERPELLDILKGDKTRRKLKK